MPETPGKKRILFIVNPISGSRRKRNLPRIINDHVDKKQFEVSIVETQYGGHAIELSKRGVEEGYHVIVAVGGDGTVNEVASQMIHSDAVLGIIPGGSGNGLARHLNIPLTPSRAIELINKWNVTTIDTAKVNDTSFVSIAGVGFDALVAKKFAEKSSRGFLTYFRIAMHEFLNYRPKKYTLIFDDGTKIKRKAFFISFANSNQFGYNTQIAPNARLNDGKIDVCIAKKPNFLQAPILANLLLLNMIDRSPLMEIIPATGVKVKRKRNRVVNIDGEPVKLKRNFYVKVIPASLKVLIPQNVKE
jgi:YegS/Rv2252/BmrU family lipid kinase